MFQKATKLTSRSKINLYTVGKSVYRTGLDTTNANLLMTPQYDTNRQMT